MTDPQDDAGEQTAVELAGHWLRIGRGDAWAWRAAADGSWEPETLTIVEHLVAEGDLVIDIGAYVGVVTCAAAARGAKVQAFEPDPVARAALQRVLAMNPELAARVTVHADALGGSARRARLSSERLGNSGASLVREQAEGAEVRVRDARTLLDIGLAQCTLLKIDVEGAEYEIVPRLLPELRQHAPSLLLSLHTYQFRERFRRLPRLLRGIAARASALPRQTRLILAARTVGGVYVAQNGTGRWLPLTGVRLLATALRMTEQELLVLGRSASGKTDPARWAPGPVAGRQEP